MNIVLKRINGFVSYILIFLIHLPFVFAKIKPGSKPAPENSLGVSAALKNMYSPVYDSLKLDRLGLSKAAYDYAIRGFNYLLSSGKVLNDKIISIVDFSLPSGKKRLFILDLKNCSVLFNTYVAHGKNSGKDFANQFSNNDQSYKSSLGFYVTGDTYVGNHGYSLRLKGEEKGINDNAGNRAIVMHSAWYVNENIAKSQGYIGRSQGCPALPEELSTPIIEKIKNGSCLFLYSPDKYYMSHSEILHKVQNA